MCHKHLHSKTASISVGWFALLVNLWQQSFFVFGKHFWRHNAANLNRAQILKTEYQNLKCKLGRVPHLKEFDEHGELDPEYKNCFTKEQESILEFVSYRFASGMRIHELSLLKTLINMFPGTFWTLGKSSKNHLQWSCNWFKQRISLQGAF